MKTYILLVLILLKQCFITPMGDANPINIDDIEWQMVKTETNGALSQDNRTICLTKLQILMGDSSLIIRVISDRLNANQDHIEPIFIYGPSGVGKSEIANIIAKLSQLRLIEVNLDNILLLDEVPRIAVKKFFDFLNRIDEPILLALEVFELEELVKPLNDLLQLFKQNYNKKKMFMVCMSSNASWLHNYRKIPIDLPNQHNKLAILLFYYRQNNLSYDQEEIINNSRHVSRKYTENLIADSTGFSGKNFEFIVTSAATALEQNYLIPEQYRNFVVLDKGYFWNGSIAPSAIELQLNVYHQLVKGDLKREIEKRNAIKKSQASSSGGFLSEVLKAAAQGIKAGVEQGINESITDHTKRYVGESDIDKAERETKIEIFKSRRLQLAQAAALKQRYESGQMEFEAIETAKIEAKRNAYLLREQIILEAEMAKLKKQLEDSSKPKDQ